MKVVTPNEQSTETQKSPQENTNFFDERLGTHKEGHCEGSKAGPQQKRGTCWGRHVGWNNHPPIPLLNHGGHVGCLLLNMLALAAAAALVAAAAAFACTDTGKRVVWTYTAWNSGNGSVHERTRQADLKYERSNQQEQRTSWHIRARRQRRQIPLAYAARGR